MAVPALLVTAEAVKSAATVAFAVAALDLSAVELWQPKQHLNDYMLACMPVNPGARDQIAAVVHVDGTTRGQVVRSDAPGVLPAILKAGYQTGLHLINTSFNVAKQPIVNSAEDAVSAFGQIPGLSFLILEDELLVRSASWHTPMADLGGGRL